MTLATFIPIFVFFVFVMIIVIVSQSIKSEKKKKEEESRRAQNTRTRLDDEPFSEVTGGSAPVRKYIAPMKSVDVRAAKKAPVKIDGTDLYEAAPKVRTSARVVGIARSHHDEHCDVDHSDDDLYIVEKVPVSGSIGGKSDEGCWEHYGLRFVKIDASDDGNGKIEVTPDDVRRAIILGEVINDPAYKK